MPIYLNVGSGQRPFKKPWINTDVQERWKEPTEAAECDWWNIKNFTEGAPNQADIICLHHVLEHFGCGEADKLVDQCYELLKPGGSLIITVPDMKALARGWLVGRITDQIYFTNVYGAYMGDEADRHRWNYTFDSLKETLYKRGNWSTIKPFDWRDIDGADIAKDWWILGVEAVK